MLYSIYHYFPYAFLATIGTYLLVCVIKESREERRPRR